MVENTEEADKSEFITIAQMAARLRISVAFARSLVLQGRIPAVRIGDVAVRVREKDLEQFLASSPVDGPSELRDGRRRGRKPGRRSSRARRARMSTG